jgi:hypothetical protein
MTSDQVMSQMQAELESESEQRRLAAEQHLRSPGAQEMKLERLLFAMVLWSAHWRAVNADAALLLQVL